MINSTYIIGEIGQNHNGSLDIAKLIVEMVAKPIKEELFGLNLHPINAVKLTKRDLNEELSQSQMLAPYDNENSFGSTYGEHREYLELSDEEHFEIFKFAKSLGLDFVETICAKGAMSVLKLFTPDFLKVASRDLTNLPLLEALAETKIPIIISTGMADKKELDDALNTVTRYHTNISILHCVSQYPTHPDNVNLLTLNYLKSNYPDYIIGYSDHTIGIAMPLASVAMGAKIVEKHITLDRRMKGTDQKGSLGVDGLNRMIRDIRLLERSLGVEDIFISKDVESARFKLERSIASIRDIKKGEVLTQDMFHLLSPGDGVKWSDKDQLIGKKLAADLQKNEIIYSSLLQ